MIDIDPSRLDLAREFKARPFGVHSPDLQAVLNRMRSAPVPGKHYLIMTRSHAQWVLARMTGDPLRLEVVPGFVFDSLEQAEWLHRLDRLRGQPLAQRLRQQRGAAHDQRAAALRRPGPLRPAGGRRVIGRG
jgi:hypothetical protein